ncbi:MAG: 5'-deoxynucleotidase [Lachnospiraceae bacterium]|jgi:5'-deoxynucleotidase|nr:5'-deoxynucleotidase [Lachnospiraceae bacterium]MCR5212411.1 5'-deoxynucleotidase [Lachnospiraceae bacterium]
MENNFFAMISRLKWIDRWALMKNSSNENLSEHSLEVAMIAHALCVIGNKRLGKNLNGERAALIGMYHDATEIITGDMPTPVKYYNDEIRHVYKDIEKEAQRRLISLLPADLSDEYESIFSPGEELSYEKKLVKGADKLSAYIKCIEEEKAGNREFLSAEEATLRSLKKMDLPEVDIFIEECIPGYRKTLDELRC